VFQVLRIGLIFNFIVGLTALFTTFSFLNFFYIVFKSCAICCWFHCESYAEGEKFAYKRVSDEAVCGVKFRRVVLPGCWGAIVLGAVQTDTKSLDMGPFASEGNANGF